MTHKFALSDLVIFTVLMHQTEFSKIFWGLCPWTRPHWGLRHQTPATVPSAMQAPHWSRSLTEHSARFARHGCIFVFFASSQNKFASCFCVKRREAPPNFGTGARVRCAPRELRQGSGFFLAFLAL